MIVAIYFTELSVMLPVHSVSPVSKIHPVRKESRNRDRKQQGSARRLSKPMTSGTFETDGLGYLVFTTSEEPFFDQTV